MGLSTFFGLNIGVNALEAMQQAQSVVSNNISNANTPGYVQETAVLQEGAPFPPAGDQMIAGQISQGSEVGSVSRQTNAFINRQDRLNQGTQQMYATHSQNLTQIESILNEPSSSSIQNQLDQFFQSWQTLSTDSTNTAARQAVIAQAQTLGQTFQTISSQTELLQQGLATTVSGQLGELNQYATQVASLNKQIVTTQRLGQSPNTLLDQRASFLDKMSQLANVSYNAQTDGSVTVSLGSGANTFSLVDATGAHTLPSNLLPTNQNQYVGSNASSFSAPSGFSLSDITSGAIAGNVQSIDDTSGLLAHLDTFLQQFAKSVNTVQSQGYDANNTAGTSIFTTTPTTPAGNTVLQVSTTFLAQNGTDLIAASGVSGQGGDNSNAVAMANLQNQTSASTSAVVANGPSVSYTELFSSSLQSASYSASGTFDQYLGSLVSNVGTEAATVNSSGKTANALAQQSSNMRQSVSGVSTDQEAAKMVEYENTYNAAAKFISVFNQMLQTLINSVN